jgi:hypothetical protein
MADDTIMVACSEGNTTDFLGLVLRYERGEEGKTTCVLCFVPVPSCLTTSRRAYEYVDRSRYSLKLIQKIHTYTVDKLNKSKLTGNVNINKMVLPLVSWWWWSCCFCLAKNATTNHRQALQRWAAAGDESATT